MVPLRRSFAKLAAGVLLAMLAFAGFAQVEPRYAELPNFHRVNQQLYRGGQPKDGGLRKLKDLGVKTIVNLRGEDAHTRAESEEAHSLGLRYHSISLPEFSRPKDEEVEQVLGIINDPENQPVFIHCHHGKDRTGTIVASRDSLCSARNTYQCNVEARRYGLGWVEVGMRRYIDKYYARYKASHAT